MTYLDDKLNSIPHMAESVENLRHVNSVLLPLLLSTSMVVMDPYTSSIVSVARDPQTRTHTIDYYYKLTPGTDQLYLNGKLVRTQGKRSKVACMLTGVLGSSSQVIAAHLVPRSTKLAALEYIGLKPADVNSPQNCLLLSANIEKAFDRKDISFIPNTLQPSRYRLIIWTTRGLKPSAKHPGDVRLLPIFENNVKKIGDFEGDHLEFGEKRPFKRALSFQLYMAHRHAMQNNWLDESDEFYHKIPADFGTPVPDGCAFQRSMAVVSLLNLSPVSASAETKECDPHEEADIQAKIDDLDKDIEELDLFPVDSPSASPESTQLTPHSISQLASRTINQSQSRHVSQTINQSTSHHAGFTTAQKSRRSKRSQKQNTDVAK